MKDMNAKTMAYGGLLAALSLLLTMYVHVPMPMTQGYVHLGDAAVVLSGLVMGPWGAIPAALGSALADLLSGFGLYAIPTFIIKGAMALAVGAFLKDETGLSLKCVLVLILCELWMVLGYFVFEGFVYGWATGVADLLGNAVQGGAGAVLGAVLCQAAPRLRKSLK